MSKPLIGIPLGDPAGIGPEIVVKALLNPKIYTCARPVVIGSAAVLRQTAEILRADIKINTIAAPKEGNFAPGIVNLIDLANIEPKDYRHGTVGAAAGRAAYEYIRTATELALDGQLAALATTPINKEAIRASGIDFIGHTEMLAALTKTENPLTMFQTGNLRIFFLSRHLSLRAALELVTKENIIRTAEQCLQALARLGFADGCLAIAALNPHGGEHGLFGTEEMTEIAPAVEALQARGLNVEGPVPADSVFHLARTGLYDAVLSLYHDQGHIAAKTADFDRTVSLTLGLPFLRTSVDHGTAFGIAGKGIASAVSMEEAIIQAASYCPHYRP
ncbi:MAG: 4-hydroxythreonine-4-phosphate dehydrogenase PdxA [Firmicutes bacterium]|jgi:4-hydroxythreonine-4-phosphate dehydrogenase|nr:4-hydroxythreonine-4-phosphate dehydrogenase PdxA [Bacillota bacterium]